MERLLKQVKQTPTTSQSSNYKCSICRDTGWVQSAETNLYKRCECIEAEYVQKLWAIYGVNPNEAKKINEYVDYDEATKKAKANAIKYINNFDKDKSVSFGVFGQNGSGKSHLCIAIGAELINRKNEVVYMPYVESMKELKLSAVIQETYGKLSDRYQKAKVLIIDDLFKDKTKNGTLIGDISETDIKHFYPILNYRYYNNLPTIFSTECTPEMLIKLDEAQAGRILQMCGDYITIFRDVKNNYRLRKFIK